MIYINPNGFQMTKTIKDNDVPKYDNISDFSKSRLSHGLALTSSIIKLKFKYWPYKTQTIKIENDMPLGSQTNTVHG